MFLPVVLAFTYIFDIDTVVDINKFILIVSLVNISVVLIGAIVLLIRKDHFKRIVRPNYRTEFIYLAIVSLFGLLGLVVFYDYLGGNRDYIANILVVLFAFLVYVLITLGRKFFKFDYMKEK